ncbi:MAG: hypothetical protein A2756_04990 [Candidatus Ryanbacteria bacterium RIFCSPHIGHO2_01_FULL_48_27]|uniref:DNA methylase N-4/N-6 domain-containing protein n=1 Tax=Candidatus Ryanbacteria bacterium RIFCSPHIGHO2_01_FULL_48_27 TaxID=1802115 RepID=A0A1G2G3F3_9BACT|nr:MAG: hypothetical protein A2756_04990 [Candidatus Ryanbacteria bacterium RIFCSPHIGHO2_01_FULL_48_27]
MAKEPQYKDWSRERLAEEVKQLKKRKKYGIVWEHKPEDVVEQCKTQLPVLKEVKTKEIVNDTEAPTNLLIEGDNYHALSVLSYTHKGKISVIYIDPPYNTGARDWKYNNDYVDINDAFRHSKWLSMMHSRLLLAKKLLKPNGVLIVTIDDHELPSITALLRDLGAKSLGRAAICIKPEGRRQSSYLMEAHEYALFVSWGKPKIRGLNIDFGLDFPEKDEKSTFRWEGLMRRDAGREDRGSDYWYPFYVGPGGELSVEKKNKYREILPINTKGIERVWLWDKARAAENLADLQAVIRKEKITIYYKRREQGRVKPTTFWYGSRYNANAYGTRILDAIVPNNGFDYPKSIYSVLDCLDLFTPPDGIVLDYFAGSGTTGHAVMLLNKVDKGKGTRQFILVTNNENQIAEKVTYPRIKNSIEGVRALSDITGFDANLKYFRTAFVGGEPTDANKEALTKEATEMICVREGTFDSVKNTEAYKIFSNAKQHTGIVYDQLALPAFKKVLEKTKGLCSVYVFSLGDDTFDEEFTEFGPRVTVSPIPEAILRVYRRIFATK